MNETRIPNLPEVPDPVVNVAFADIAAADAVVTPRAVPVEKTNAVELLRGYAAEVKLVRVEAETLKVVNDEVIFRADVVISGTVETVPVVTITEVVFATGIGVKLPTIENTDVLVVKDMIVLVVTDVNRMVPTLPLSGELVPLGGKMGTKLSDTEGSAVFPVGPGANVALRNESMVDVDVEVARVVLFLMLEGDPVTVVVDEAFVVRLPTGSDMLAVYGTEVSRKGTVLVAVIAAEALVENEFIRVKFKEGAAVAFKASAVVENTPTGVDVSGRTDLVEVEVIVLIASVVMTETEVLILFLLDDGVRRRLDDSRLLVSE
ncbi:hypothetical protein VPNG_03523 [Cytospora leucostoma]|uniref:Uncharacterized protein n=1 Tax=Cytospora leucostoma TaxID=1230097 RepID=A0A423XCJ3_9PEZI|nr:hypothetical protein VPNG_03523 [Cytospora leucostoma]